MTEPTVLDEPTKPLWERQAWDTPMGFEFFRYYLNQEAPRSLLKAYNEFRRSKMGQNRAKDSRYVPGTYRNIAQGKTGRGISKIGAVDFKTRALAWEDHIASLEREKWKDRKLELQETEWKIANELLDKAKLMLAFPIVEQLSADGMTLIRPADWKLRDIMPVAQLGSQLARLAAGMETENIKINWQDEARKAGYDPDSLFTEWVKYFYSLGKSDDKRSLEDSPGKEEAAQE